MMSVELIKMQEPKVSRWSLALVWWRPTRLARFLRTFGLIFAVVALPLLVSRNSVSRYVAQRLASSLLETRVHIESVFIGWGAVQVTGITVFDPVATQEPQVTVGQVDISINSFDGLRQSVWLDRVAIDRPTLNVHFDADGKLLSQFPSPGSSSQGETKLPLRSLSITNARVVVHQGSRRSAIVDGANIVARFQHEYQVKIKVDKLLDGRVDVLTRVDAKSLAGTTQVSVEGCRLDSNALPGTLLPASIRRHRFGGSASLSATIDHPADEQDVRFHPARLNLKLYGLQLDHLPTPVHQLSVHASSDADGIVVDVHADPLDGIAKIRVDASPPVLPISATIATDITDCNLGPLVTQLAGGVPLQTHAAMHATSTIRWDGNLASFSNSIRAVASNLAADKIESEDVVCEIECDGAIPMGAADVDLLSSMRGDLKASVHSGGIQVSQLAERFGISDLAGRVGFSGSIQLPLDRLLSPSAYRADANVDLDRISACGASLSDTQVRMNLDQGKVGIRLAEGAVVSADGQLLARASVVVQADLETNIVSAEGHLNDVHADQVAELFQVDDELISGAIAASIEATNTIDSVAKPTAWKSTAVLDAQRLVVAGETIRDFQIECILDQGTLTLPRTEFGWRDNLCHVEAAGTLDDQLTIDGSFQAGPIRIEDCADVISRLSDQPLALSGLALINGEIHLDTQQRTFRCFGKSHLVNAVYAGIEIGSADLDWDADQAGLTVGTRSDRFLGGSYSLAARMNQLDWTRSTVDLQFKQIQCSKGPALIGIAIPVTGVVEGGCRLTSLGTIGGLTGTAWIRSQGVTIRQVPVELTRGNMSIAHGKVDLAAEGQVLQGTFKADAECGIKETLDFIRQEKLDLRQLPVDADVTLTGVSVEQTARSLGVGSLQPLSGLVHATCKRDESSRRDGLICTASGTVEGIRWENKALTDRAIATVKLRPDRLELESIDGLLAGGRLSGRGEVSLAGSPRGYFQLGVNRMNLRLAAAPLGRAIKDVTGTANVQVDGRIGRVITGRAQLSANHPSVADLNVRAVRLPVDWSFAPSTGRATWRLRSGVIDAGAGKINVSSEGDYSNALNMRFAAQLNHIETSRMMRGGSVDLGILDGRVNLQAKRARSLQQITGNFDLSMSKIDSLELPILDQLDSFIKLTPSFAASQSDTGVIQGRLSGGLVHVDRLAISQSNVQVLMDGEATLDGRLNFDVTAATGQTGPADGLAALAGSPILLAAPAPVALVLKANEAMKDRVVHVHVGGTATRPVLRLQPGKQLTQDTLRFFLTNSFGSRVADAVDVSRQRVR